MFPALVRTLRSCEDGLYLLEPVQAGCAQSEDALEKAIRVFRLRDGVPHTGSKV